MLRHLVVGLVLCAGACTPSTNRQKSLVPEAPPHAASQPGSGIPACRLSEASGPLLEAAKLAFDAVAQLKPLPFERIAAQHEPKALPLYLIEDALSEEVDQHGCLKSPPSAVRRLSMQAEPGKEYALDALSVRGVCSARHDQIRCAMGALEYLQAREGEGTKSPTLLYVLAHELAHVAQRHETGQFNDGTLEVNVSSREQLISQLAKSCSRDSSMLKLESEADDLALRALGEAFGRPPFVAAADEDASVAISDQLERLYQGLTDLTRWLASTPGQGVGHAGAGADLCETLEQGPGSIRVPFYGGGHPRRWVRAARVVQAAMEHAGWDEQGARRKDLGALNSNLLTDTLLARAHEAQVNDFCQQVFAFEANSLDCSAPRTPGVYHVPEAALHGDLPEFPTLPVAVPAFSTDQRQEALANSDDGFAVFVQVRSYDTYRNTTLGQQAQLALHAAVERLMEQLADHAKANGSVWIYEQNQGVELRAAVFSSKETTVAFSGVSIFKSKTPLSANMFSPELRDDLIVESIPWKNARYEAILHFFDQAMEPNRDPLSGGPRNDRRVLTKRLGLAQIFDLQAAATGQVNAMAQAFGELIRFVKHRLDARLGKTYSLFEPGDPSPPFYLATRNPVFSENLYLPLSWIPAAEGSTARVHTDGALSAQISRAFAGEQLGAAELVELFGPGAGEQAGPAGLVTTGLAYLEGLGVPRDEKKAAELFRRACDQGHAPGCTEFAWALIHGSGVAQDKTQGVILLEKGCRKSEFAACARRGFLHLDLDGNPNERGAKAALPLFERACTGQNMKGCAGLGLLHHLGLALPQNQWFALGRFQQACEGGERLGCLLLGQLYIRSSEPEQDVERAGHYFEMACELRAYTGCTVVGQLYEGGLLGMTNPLGSPNFAAAERWLERGCTGGDPEGCLSLANLLTRHLAHPASHPRVVRLRQLSCRGGLSKACDEP